MIFVDPVAGVADEADTPAFQIFKTAEIIADFAGQGIGVKRVYGEIAPGRILPPIVAERDGSASSISGNIAPQCGNFDGPSIQHRCNRSEEHTSELQSLMRISYAVFCLKKKNKKTITNNIQNRSNYQT